MINYEHLLRHLGIARQGRPWYAFLLSRSPWVTGGFVLAILFASLVVGQLPGSLQTLLLLGLGALAAVVVLYAFPGIMFPSLIFLSLFLPLSIGTGTGTDINGAVLVLCGYFGFWLLKTLSYREAIVLPQTRATWALLGLLATGFISFLAGQLPWFSRMSTAPLAAQLAGLSLFLFSAMAFFLVPLQIQKLSWLKHGSWLLLAIGGVYLLGRVIPGPIGRGIDDLFSGGSTGSVFFVWLGALSFGQFLFNRRLQPLVRGALFVFIAALLFVLFIQTGGWKSGWMPLLVTVGTIAILHEPRLALLAAPVAVYFGLDAMSFLVQGDEYSLSTRLEAWQIIGELVSVNPILGLGPANYHYYTPLIPIRGYFVRFNSHNQYVDLIAQTGLVGLAFYSWFLVEVGLLAWRLRLRVKEGFASGYVYGAIGGLAGVIAAGFLGDWVLPFVYNIGLAGFRSSILAWLFFGGLLVIERHVSAAEDEAYSA